MITIRNLYAYYGQVEALKGIDLDVPKGKITCLIGSNGAGKTTLLKTISGMIRTKGSILLDGKTELLGCSPRKITKMGIAHVPEGRHVFSGLTVYENLELGTVAWRGAFSRKPYDEDIEKIFEIFPRLEERQKQLSWSLSGGEQQMLAMGRALMARPKVLLLDEPSMGLAPLLVSDLFERIKRINETTNMTILLIEQNARIAMKISDYTYVIEQGEIKLHGRSEEMMNNPDVITAYLGKYAAAKKDGKAAEE